MLNYLSLSLLQVTVSNAHSRPERLQSALVMTDWEEILIYFISSFAFGNHGNESSKKPLYFQFANVFYTWYNLSLLQVSLPKK